MSETIDVKIPDIGDASEVDVIEVLVSVGDKLEKGDSLITLETDKASMEVPSSHGGVVEAIVVKLGDKVSEGDVVVKLTSETEAKPKKTSEKVEAESPKPSKDEVPTSPEKLEKSPDAVSRTEEVRVPDIGDAKDVDIIEILVSVGDEVSEEASLITLEGDKATMDIPSPYTGKIKSIEVKLGDKISEGALILTMETADASSAIKGSSADIKPEPTTQKEEKAAAKSIESRPVEYTASSKSVYASPAVRRVASELGVDLAKVTGSGQKGRITKADVNKFVKQSLSAPAGGFQLPEFPKTDYSKYGEIEEKPLNKIKRMTAQNMRRSWLTVPHVTQFDEADITELEAFRQSQKKRAMEEGYKLTPLAFITKAVVKALIKFPSFNSSLDSSGENLILKRYYNVGIAVDTPNGLVVPVIKDADKKGLSDIAREMAELSQKARDKALKPQDMSGGCFTISSLGGISGTSFTPIVNAPEVAILGVSKSKWQPVFQHEEFVPRLMLPLSLSYDHRVIDGAEAARFSLFLTQCLSDIRTLLL